MRQPQYSDGFTGRLEPGFVALVACFITVGPLSINLYLPALLQVEADLGATSAQVQLTLTATLVGLATGQLVLGPLADAHGRRMPLGSAMAGYVAVSFGIAAAQSVALFTALRFAQGFCAAAGMVVALAIARDTYAGSMLGRVIARSMLVVGLAPVLAPFLGSQLLLVAPWRMLFVALAALGLALLGLVVFVLPETLPPERRQSTGPGVALRSYLHLVRDRDFVLVALVPASFFGVMFAYISSISQILQDQFGFTAQEVGVAFGLGAVTVTAVGQLTGSLLRRTRPERMLQVGVYAGVPATLALVVATHAGAGALTTLGLAYLVLATCGAVLPTGAPIALAHQAERAGAASAVLGALQFGVGAAIAPVTGLFGQQASTLALVMLVPATVAAALLAVVSRRWRRAVPTPQA